MKINTESYLRRGADYFERLQDVRVLGQIIFVVIVLLISWSGVKSIQTNFSLQKQITGLSQQNDLQKLQNNNLQLSKTYYQSNQYQELSARQNFGLAAAGEKVIVVPKAVALANTSDIPVPTVVGATVTSRERGNFEAWVDFFLHRTAN